MSMGHNDARMASRFTFAHAGLLRRSGQERVVHSAGSAKQASVLFDEIAFERRFLVLEGPPERRVARLVSVDEAKRMEASGADIAEWAETSDLFDDDPEAPGSGHGSWNGLHEALEQLGCEWSREVFYDPAVVDATPALPGEERSHRELRAIAIAYQTAIYQPSSTQHLLGGTALAIVVPDIHRLPWQAIAGFREHPGSHEARHRLRDFDAEARRGSVDVEDLQAFERSVAHEVTRALLSAWAETRPRAGLGVAKEAVKTGIGFVPLVGAAISATASLAEIATDVRAHDRTWLSALWNLASSERHVA